MMKLCVGIRDVADLRAWQAARFQRDGILKHKTGNFPRRAEEVIDGGSMYWVIAGAMVVRQRITDIIADTKDDGSACAGLVLGRTLVPVAGRPTKAFQGWRYLAATDVPSDLTKAAKASGAEKLPPAMLRDLRALGLL